MVKKIFHLFLFITVFASITSCNKSYEFNIVNCGADPSGKSLSTVAIQKAIDKAHSMNGTVFFPKGEYLCGTLFLKSNIKLVFSNGSILRCSGNINDFAKYAIVDHQDREAFHLLVADSVENITIEGQGIIDGNGKAYWKERESEFHFYPPVKPRVSPLVEIYKSTGVILRDFKIINSPGWTVHLNQSTNIIIDGITIDNNLYGPNSDGLDINGCHDVRISNCNIKAGDDAIVVKTTKESRSSENITVSNCILETNCVALKLGTESHHDFRYITFNNIVVKNCSRVFSLICNDGATMEFINASNVVAKTNSGWILNRVIELNANKRTENSANGTIRNVSIQNFQVQTDGRVLLGAANGSNIENISINNLMLEYKLLDDPFTMATKTENDIFFFKSLPLLRGARASIAAENIANLSISNIKVIWPTYPLDSQWKLLTSPINWGNEAYRDNNKQNLIQGKVKPAFAVLWIKDIKTAFIDLRGTSSSEKKYPLLQQQNCSNITLNK